MEIKAKLFPYPVLSEYSNDYIRDKFKVTVKTTRLEEKPGEAKYRIDFKAHLTSKGLLDLIAQQKACYAYHLECSQTCFRKLLLTSDPETSYNLDDTVVNGRLEISCFVVATKDISQYYTKEFNHSYRDIQGFDIEESCILATGRTTVINIGKELDELARAPSIFAIVKNNDASIRDLQVDMQNRKIIIKLPEKPYYGYKQMSNNPAYTPILNSLTVLFSLVFVLEELERQSQNERAASGDILWYQALQKMLLEKFSINLEAGELDSQMDILTLAQVLLGHPLEGAFDFLTTSSWGGETE